MSAPPANQRLRSKPLYRKRLRRGRTFPFSTIPIPWLDSHRLWCYPQILADSRRFSLSRQTAPSSNPNRRESVKSADDSLRPHPPRGRAAEGRRPEAQHPPGIAELPFGAFPPPATAAQEASILIGLIFQRQAGVALRGPRQGVQDGSRWLSEATPPVTGTKVPTTPAGGRS